MASRASSLLLRQATRSVAAPLLRRAAPVASLRAIHNNPPRQDDKPGSYARISPDIEHQHPEEHELPSSEPVTGIDGQYVKPTLAGFSLDGNVGVVTGGARGLGLVIGQGMVFSGSDLALVDMNSKLMC